MVNDPTYNRQAIEANPVWKLAFRLSELDNDQAPLGWGRYISLAHWLRGQIASDLANAIDAWVRGGGGTFDELEALVQRALSGSAE